ncbi:hypothetical protein EG329_012763 [Mollisiaceae sp. DMI_Dod_QoI]|nr:hypothetical protein EG329_012763 [Helotiales sp. DMI_Dod_QoI]
MRNGKRNIERADISAFWRSKAAAMANPTTPEQSCPTSSANPGHANTAASMANEVAIMKNPANILTARQTPTLLALPDELQAKVYGFACTHSGLIKPELWLPGSSKFAHDKVYTTLHWGQCIRDPVRINGCMPEALSAVDINLACKKIHSIVDGENLFYKLNSFEFRNPLCMLHYLKALPSHRRQALKNVIVLWDYLTFLVPALTVLSTCTGLRHLSIDITLMAKYFATPSATVFDRAPGFDKLISLRGLESLTITYGEDEATGTCSVVDGDISTAVSNPETATNQTTLNIVKHEQSTNVSPPQTFPEWDTSIRWDTEDFGQTAGTDETRKPNIYRRLLLSSKAKLSTVMGNLIILYRRTRRVLSESFLSNTHSN